MPKKIFLAIYDFLGIQISIFLTNKLRKKRVGSLLVQESANYTIKIYSKGV